MNNVLLDEFLFNVIVMAIFVVLLWLFYIYFGNVIFNCCCFVNNFLLLALGILFIIMIVKFFIVLFLGLVGVLFIVCYWVVIKDLEELIYFFIVIGLGFVGGVN